MHGPPCYTLSLCSLNEVLLLTLHFVGDIRLVAVGAQSMWHQGPFQSHLKVVWRLSSLPAVWLLNLWVVDVFSQPLSPQLFFIS